METSISPRLFHINTYHKQENFSHRQHLKLPSCDHCNVDKIFLFRFRVKRVGNSENYKLSKADSELSSELVVEAVKETMTRITLGLKNRVLDVKFASYFEYNRSFSLETFHHENLISTTPTV